jgi:hypothetical protein
MDWWRMVVTAAAGIPVLRACWRNRASALVHALTWAMAAWLTWVAAAATGTIIARYLALSLTACAGVAVLGARRPGAAAWHAVVAGLLALLLMTPAHGLLAGAAMSIDTIRLGFLAAALVVGLVNYLPTRLGLGALALLAACLLELRHIEEEMPALERTFSLILAASAPWLAWAGRALWRSGGPEAEVMWRDFRDRYGLVWAQRLREQFNRAAEHAGLGVELGWRRLHKLDGSGLSENERAASLDLLTALMKRFGVP